MGYRSDVTIALDTKIYEKHKLLDALPEMFSDRYIDDCSRGTARDNEDYVITTYYNILWFKAVAVVKELIDFLNNLPPEGYAVIRIGVNMNDIEIQGDPSKYGLSVERSVRWDPITQGMKHGL